MEEIKTNEKPYLAAETEETVKAGKKKTFAPGQHILFKRYSLSRYTDSFGVVRGGQLEIPEGYQIISIQNVIRTSMFGGTETYGVYIWLINYKKVSVEAVYNEPLRIYDYSEPGTVIETMVEEESPTLTFTPRP